MGDEIRPIKSEVGVSPPLASTPKTRKVLGHKFSTGVASDRFLLLFNKVRVNNQIYSVKTVSKETGYDRTSIKMFVKGKELEKVLSEQVKITDTCSLSWHDLSKLTKIAVPGLKKMEQDAIIALFQKISTDTGFSIGEIVQLYKEGLLTPELLQEAGQLKESHAAKMKARDVVEQALKKELVDKDKHVPISKENYETAFEGVKNLAEQNREGNALRVIKTDQRLFLVDYSTVRELGKGGFGTALKVQDVALKEHIVVKAPNAGLSEEHKKYIPRGAAILAKIHGPLTSIRGIVAKTEVAKSTLETVSALYEKGELTYVGAAGFTKPQTQALVMDTLFGLSEAHKKNIFHRDIKPQNLFVDADCHVALADWDGAVDFDDIDSLGSLSTQRYQAASDREYLKTAGKDWRARTLPPEKEEELKTHLAKMDSLALGLSYVEALTGRSFKNLDGYADPQQLLNTGLIWRTLKAKGLTSAQINGIKWMVHPDINQRKTPTEVYQALSGGKRLPSF